MENTLSVTKFKTTTKNSLYRNEKFYGGKLVRLELFFSPVLQVLTESVVSFF